MTNQSCAHCEPEKWKKQLREGIVISPKEGIIIPLCDKHYAEATSLKPLVGNKN